MKKENSICRVLKIARVVNDYTIKEAATLSNVSSSYISALEKGNKSFPSIDVISKLTKVYNLSTSQFMGIYEYYDELEEENMKKYHKTLLKTSLIIQKNLGENF